MTGENKGILERIKSLERDLEFLKRDLILSSPSTGIKPKTSLFGSVQGEDITEETIEEAKKSLFRDLKGI